MTLLLPLMVAMGRSPSHRAQAGDDGRRRFRVVAAWPLFWLMHSPDPAIELLGQLGFVLAIGAFIGASRR